MMLKRFLSASILFAAIPALSQVGPGGPGPGMPHGPMGFAGVERTPVTNAPYSATYTTTATEKLQDGTVLNHNSTRTVYRDSLGRTREETTVPAHAGNDAATSRTMITIFDPVAHTMTQLRPEQKVAVVRPIPQPPAGAAGPQAPHLHGPHEDKNVVKADLGAKTISGVVANGTRVTRTLPAGEMGNTTPIVTTHEEWFAPDLKIEVSRTDVDPFRGTRTVAISTLAKTEPDAALFTVPSGYSVQQAPDHAHRGQRHGGDMPPAAGGVTPAPGM
ncbi:MAG: hypothetical protein ACRYGF_10450 [Janthinobacterium lividum]